MSQNHSQVAQGGSPAPQAPTQGPPTDGEVTVTVTTPESQVHVLFPQPVRITGPKGQQADLHVAVFGVRAGKPTTVTGTVADPADPARSRRPLRLEFRDLPLPVREQVAAAWSKAATEIADTRIDVV